MLAIASYRISTPRNQFSVEEYHVRPTGAILGKGLIQPADPAETDGSKKSIKPARVLNDELSTRAVILANFPTLPQLLKRELYRISEKDASYDSITPPIFGAAFAISTISSLLKSIPEETGG